MMTDRWRCVPYCPPEILVSRRDPYSGRKADLWSLGVILYTMLVGRSVSENRGNPEVIERYILLTIKPNSPAVCVTRVCFVFLQRRSNYPQPGLIILNYAIICTKFKIE
jgi:serine/threonine protein kinase